MTVGAELKQGREKAGLSPEQISERTKIQLYKIDALENNTFELLPQGIYLDGIVRAYASEVGIDPERMVERVRLERGKLPGDWEIPFAGPIELHGPAAPRDIRFVDIPERDDPLGSFAAESDIAPVPIARHAAAAPNAPVAPNARLAPNAPDLPLAPNIVSAPNGPHAPHVPARPARGRARQALPVFGLLAAAFLGAYVFQSTRVIEPNTTVDSSASAPRSANDMAMTDAQTPARHSDIPVAFSESSIPSDADRRQPSDAKTAEISRDTAASAENTAPPALPHAAPTSARNRPVEPSTRAADPAGPASVGTAGSVAPAQNVSGSWKLATQIESSSYSRYAGLQLGYEMKLEQDGARVTGVGRKITENGSGIGPGAQTPLTVSGTIAGDRLTLNFVERGTQRPTQGKFVLLVDEEGALRGRFSSDAARSSGRVEAFRVSTQ